MPPKLQPVRGTHDILPEESRRRRFIIDTARAISERYGYGEIGLPIFEFSDVFHRTLGDTSDVVTKETYTFTDRGGESLTLRPEFTAGAVRAFLSSGLQNELPLKWYYTGPAFRYERPQKGRLRQFHQFGVETLGLPEPFADVEVIALGAQLLAALGLKSRVVLELNSLGDAESRQHYREALIKYFSAYAGQLSEESRLRLERNPLRILDSKDEGDQALIKDAPRLDAHYTPGACDFFARVQNGLEALGIDFTLNPKIVRGLDYYNHTVFEFTDGSLGAQKALIAGGRYDGLVEQMGGQPTPGVGFGAGIERLLLALENSGAAAPNVNTPLAVIPISEAQEMEALKLAHRLREQGFTVELLTRGNMGKKMKRADKLGAKAALILGESELAGGTAVFKNLATGEQRQVSLNALETELAPYCK